MPTIIPSYIYTDGTVLDSSGHNQNIYDSLTGRGIMSTANGDLDTNNLHANFKIRSEHIMPQTLIRTSEEFDLTDIDCFEDIFAADINDPSAFSYNTAPVLVSVLDKVATISNQLIDLLRENAD